MEIRDFVRTLARHRLLVVIVFVLVVGAGAAGAFLRPNHYKASATVTAVPPPGATFDQVTAVQFLLPSVVDEVSTLSFRSVVSSNAPPGISLNGVSISASLEQGTGILHVTASSSKRSAVIAVANAAADSLVSKPVTQGVTLSVLDPAHDTVSTRAQLRAPILASAIALGAILAIFLALIRDSFDRRLRSSEEIYERLGLEVLGEIPALRHFPQSPSELFADPASARVAEAYQRLVANLEVTLSAGNISTIAVTSSASEEGKTTVTSCLAWALALLGHDVVAIDGDLRKPNIHKRLRIEPGKGLANAADGDARPIEQSTEIDSLSAVPAGHTLLHPAQVVNQILPGVLARFADRLVLIDTPPALAAAESTLIAMMAKNVILVIDPRKRSMEEIDRVLHEFRRADVNVLGAVINRAKAGRGASYDDYYVAIPPPVKALRQSPRQRKDARSAAGGGRRTVS